MWAMLAVGGARRTHLSLLLQAVLQGVLLAQGSPDALDLHQQLLLLPPEQVQPLLQVKHRRIWMIPAERPGPVPPVHSPTFSMRSSLWAWSSSRLSVLVPLVPKSLTWSS